MRSNPISNPSGASNLDPKNRRLLTIWTIVIATLKILAINIYLICFTNSALSNSLNFKLIIGADFILISTVLIRITKFYFPIANRKR